MENKFVSVITYLHNDEKNITEFLDTVIENIKDRFAHFELICVDDACCDDTVDILKKHVIELNLEEMVTIIHMGFYQGMEASMNAGRDAAIGDFIYEFDEVCVDYDADLVMDVYEKLLTGYDIVAASRKTNRHWTSRAFYSLFNKFNITGAKIGSETFRIISRRAINRIKSLGKNIPYRKAVYANCGLNTYRNTYNPTMKTQKESIRRGMASGRGTLALDTFIYFTNVMEKLSALISGVFLLFTLAMIIYTLVDYFVEKTLAAGWPSIMIFMSIGFFGVFMLLTIIMKYMSVLLNLVFKQQKYLISDVEKIAK